MINTIEINIKSGINNIFHALIIYPRKICYINRKKYILSKEYLEELIRIIRTWENEYISNKNIDDEEFQIVIKTENDQEIFHGKGKYPENYACFKDLIGGIYVKSKRKNS